MTRKTDTAIMRLQLLARILADPDFKLEDYERLLLGEMMRELAAELEHAEADAVAGGAR